ncbi:MULTISPECIES: hypothetical protein [unclassified Pantoea]|uniref:hypothetical protein n=1 Tax=unclassified Pantoea TaxID=2630326 RepID=UPI002477AC69|nr:MULTISPECIES: hypothetical protein [unclassified Pantoea]GME47165.1 hypothetical protein ACJ3_42430 [Pantoea sp. QMID3]GME47525.1 hypothetical protein ACJ1_42770 [Pantoea sp. QMID1]GME62156.1 hypothetical protein ACJ4_42320 [Pantoea sp. QMID4]GME63489.1 hypothetical protein ACJ2_42420 [Pantoea sp. QMID2]
MKSRRSVSFAASRPAAGNRQGQIAVAGMLIEQIDTELVALHRRAAEMRGHLK